jgi:hypothetical protein
MANGRKRGGQPGNQNARKHGFYSAAMRPGEVADLDALEAEGLLDEIALVRVGIRRLFEVAGDSKAPGELASALEVIGSASVKLAGLLRTQRMIAGGQSSLSDALSQALGEVCGELTTAYK